MIPPDDRGLTLGDGVFETVLSEAGRLICWPEHMARMARGAAALDLPAPDPEAARQAAFAAQRAAGLEAARAAVRLSWTAGSGGRGLNRPETLSLRLAVTCAPAPLATSPVRLALSSVRRNEGSPASRHKTLAYLDNVLARREARALGADEAIMLNNRGELACAAAANLFWLKEGVLFTPALDCGVLPGIVRAQTMVCAAALGLLVREVAAEPAALEGADAVFITSSLIGLRDAERGSGEGRAIVAALRIAVDDLRTACS